MGHEEGTNRQEKRDKVNFTSLLEDLVFKNDIALLSSPFNDLRKKTGDWWKKQPEYDLNLMRESARH